MNQPRYFVAHREHLREHPKNMNTHYPQAQLDEMARSLAANANRDELGVGNQSALLVAPFGNSEPRFRQDQSTGVWYLVEGLFHVVDGNRRYRGGGILKAQCPPFECKWGTADEVEQRLQMTIANNLRYKPNIIDEARHYRALREEDGLTNQQIADYTGMDYNAIGSALKWLELEPEIQELVQQGKLHQTVDVAHALLTIRDTRARVKLALKFADEKLSIKAIERACEKFNVRVEQNARHNARAANPEPMVGRGERLAGRTVQTPTQPAAWKQVREAARVMCGECDVKLDMLQRVAEPAWVVITHEANEICEACDVRRVKDACEMCPGPQLIKNLILRMERQPELAVELVAAGTLPSTPSKNGNGNGHGKKHA